MNAFSEKDMANPASIERIELVLEELYSLNGMALFTNLKSLTLINVNIKKIEVLIIYGVVMIFDLNTIVFEYYGKFN